MSANGCRSCTDIASKGSGRYGPGAISTLMEAIQQAISRKVKVAAEKSSCHPQRLHHCHCRTVRQARCRLRRRSNGDVGGIHISAAPHRIDQTWVIQVKLCNTPQRVGATRARPQPCALKMPPVARQLRCVAALPDSPRWLSSPAAAASWLQGPRQTRSCSDRAAASRQDSEWIDTKAERDGGQVPFHRRSGRQARLPVGIEQAGIFVATVAAGLPGAGNRSRPSPAHATRHRTAAARRSRCRRQGWQGQLASAVDLPSPLQLQATAMRPCRSMCVVLACPDSQCRGSPGTP